MNYVVQEVSPDTAATNVYQPYGVVNDFFHDTSQEVMLSGPYDTGKTFGALQKLLMLSWLYRNLHILVVRKTYSSLKNSAIQTLYDKVLPDHPDNLDEYDVYGGGTPQSFTVLPTGSTWKFGGMDEPKRILSSEYDYIFVPQAEELNVGEWEDLMGRCNGRAGHSPWPQIMGDCNPDVPSHWIKNRPTLNLFETTHKDNPTIYMRDDYGNLIYDVDGNALLTPGGAKRVATLKAMTGLRYQRGFLGLWVGAEGVVYKEFDRKKHIIPRAPIPPEWRKYMVIDFGFNHPFVAQWWAVDDEGRLIMYREMYMTERSVHRHIVGIPELGVPGILRYSEGERIRATICDHDADNRATLLENGIQSIPADKRVQVGIEKVEERLKIREDGIPGLLIMEDSLVEVDETLKNAYKPTSTIEEFPGYVWASLGDKAESAKDERPIKKNDHGMDAMRYMVMYLDGMNSGQVKVRRYA